MLSLRADSFVRARKSPRRTSDVNGAEGVVRGSRIRVVAHSRLALTLQNDGMLHASIPSSLAQFLVQRDRGSWQQPSATFGQPCDNDRALKSSVEEQCCRPGQLE